MIKTIKAYARCYWEDLKALRRGERRVAPRPIMRGRVYARKRDAGDVSDIHKPASKTRLVVSAKVIRRNGRVEDLGVVSRTKLTGAQRKQLEENGNG